MPLVAPWDESKYKRAPMGASGSTGGQFVSKGFKSAPDNQKASKAVAALASQAISGAALAPVRQFLADGGLINRALRGSVRSTRAPSSWSPRSTPRSRSRACSRASSRSAR
jgi:hypothetical protein